MATSTARVGLLTPVKAAVGRWAAEFHSSYFFGDTPANAEWKARDTPRAVIWAPGRMVDQAEEMLATWKRNRNSQVVSTSAFLPVLFVAAAQEYTEPSADTGKTIPEPIEVILPEDPLCRVFKLRTVPADIRFQFVAIAPEVGSTSSILAQLAQWSRARPTVYSSYVFAGVETKWPVRFTQDSRLAVSTPLGEHMSVLAMDVVVRAMMPVFIGDDSIDGKGLDVITDVVLRDPDPLGPPTGVGVDEWHAYNHQIVVLRDVRACA